MDTLFLETNKLYLEFWAVTEVEKYKRTKCSRLDWVPFLKWVLYTPPPKKRKKWGRGDKISFSY